MAKKKLRASSSEASVYKYKSAQVSIVNVSYANFKYKSGQVSNVIVSYGITSTSQHCDCQLRKLQVQVSTSQHCDCQLRELQVLV